MSSLAKRFLLRLSNLHALLNGNLMCSLSLSGKKISASVIKSAGGAYAAGLKELHLEQGKFCMDEGSKEAIRNLLKGAPLLEKLSLNSSFGIHNIRSATKQVRRHPSAMGRRVQHDRCAPRAGAMRTAC